jgi:8-oxo-dGTP diphosphatase
VAVLTETQISAGGIVVRGSGPDAEVALISVGSPPRWQLPKGLIDAGESPESAAIREVREEAGVEAQTVNLIEKVEYWYQAARGKDRVRYHKFVYFYLMKYLSGDVTDHDHEVNEAEWVPLADAENRLAFRSEKAVAKKALAAIL